MQIKGDSLGLKLRRFVKVVDVEQRRSTLKQLERPCFSEDFQDQILVFHLPLTHVLSRS